MGSGESGAEGMEELSQWIYEKAFEGAGTNTEFLHLTEAEKNVIDNTILKIMETNRRIETKLLQLGQTDERVLDPLKW